MRLTETAPPEFIDWPEKDQNALLDQIVDEYQKEVGRSLTDDEKEWVRSDAIGKLTERPMLRWLVPTMRIPAIRAVFSDEMNARAEMEAAAKGLLAIIDKTKREKASDLTSRG